MTGRCILAPDFHIVVLDGGAQCDGELESTWTSDEIPAFAASIRRTSRSHLPRACPSEGQHRPLEPMERARAVHHSGALNVGLCRTPVRATQAVAADGRRQAL